jgi:hypothetical protein
MEVKRQLPSTIGIYNETHKHFPLEYDRDCEDIQGWEIHAGYVDEAGQLTPYMLDYIISRNRLGGYEKVMESWGPELNTYKARLPRYALSANPGGISHHYLKTKFIDPGPPETIFYDPSLKDPSDPEDKGWSTIYIPASMRDNQYLDAGYAAQFGNLPEHQQRQLRDGDWNVVPGAFFDCFDSQKHVIKPFAIPDHWTRFRACDWGHATPFSVGWWAVSDGQPVTGIDGINVIYPEGALIRYREWYGCVKKHGLSTTKGMRLSGTELGVGILERQKENENINYSVADPSMWRSDGGPSQAERALKAGVVFQKADNQRELGWQEMYRRMKDGMLFVFNNCHDFIRTIPAIQADERQPEDITKTNRGGEDHIADETRYACMSRPIIRKQPKKKPPIRGLCFNDMMKELSRKREERIRI